MGKKSLVAALAAVIIVCVLAASFGYSQFSSIQAEKDELISQNIALQTQNSTLQEQIQELQLQNREQQDRLSDYTYQLAVERPLKAEITGAFCSSAWGPFGGLTVSYPANATIVDNDAVPLYGLSVSFRLVDRDNGRLIGDEIVIKVDHIETGESKEVAGCVLTVLDTNIDNAVCRITLLKGSIILDEFTQELT